MNSLFQRIWLAIFLTGMATFLLLITLSAKVLVGTGSSFAANLVVLTVWMPAVLALPLIKATVAKYSARAILVFAEIGSALAIPFVFPLAGFAVPLILLLVLKGYFDALSKVSRTTALKAYFSGEALDKAASYYNTASLAGIGVGALAAAVLIARVSLAPVLVICTLIHLASAGIYWSLPTPAPSGRPASATPASLRQGDPNLYSAVVYLISTVALYQGYLNIARAVFPIKNLNMPESSIGLIQAITSLAYVVGAFIAAQFAVKKDRYVSLAGTVHSLVIFTLVPIPFITVKMPGLISYALFALTFEAAFCIHIRQIILAAPAEQIAKLMANANAVAIGAMVVFSFVGSYFVDAVGLTWITAVTLGLAALVPVGLWLQQRSIAKYASTQKEY